MWNRKESQQLTRKLANRIIEACFEKSIVLASRPIAAVVLDGGGHLLAVQRDERGGTLLAKIAVAKASGAAGMGMSSRKLGRMATASPNFIACVGPLSPGGIIAGAGAVLVVSADQILIGVVAVAGDSPDNDEICALAGVAAVGLSVQG